MKRYALGIDGGGTKTQALVADEESNVCGSGVGSPSNYDDVGMILIAGTGSSCYGQNAADESWIAGGWGHLISDEGSSYWLGIQAMRCVVASHDGRLHSVLKELVQDHFRLIEMKDLMHRIYVTGLSR